MGLSPYVERIVKEAEEANASAIVLEINTFGGRVDAAVTIRDLLINTKIKTIAFVNKRAISAGALITLACQSVVMAPGSSIGAATPVQLSPGGKAQDVGEKMVSYMRKEFSATAEYHKRPQNIAEAMVDKDVEIEGLIEKGKLLTMTQEEALKWEIADFSGEDIDDLLAKSNLKGARIVTLDINWAEKIARFITNPTVSSILVSLGMLGLLIEFYTPGLGFSGIVGLICLGSFFWGHTIVNLAGFEEVILFSVGIVLLVLEVFVIPGFGIAGILGIICLVAGLALAVIGHPFSMPALTGAITRMSLSLVATIVVFVALLRFMPKRYITKGLVLASVSPKQSNSEVQSVLVGAIGVALTTLRPAGKASFDGVKCDVISDGDYIEKSSQVKVVQVEGTKIVVQTVS